ncbi:glycerol-3-phosphate 1-O-acyltransferase PlsY [Allosphingosinicella sp.]|uniref:glycerol-3-phosphate 1-O-acyltransferase PlsY n=1 Tax=Allosphingosinicella sp. TaxID=2823234 RepID=UPI003784BA3E
MTPEIFLPPTLCFLLAYALGAIPFGLLLTRAAGLGDVRNIGSGNIGATNVLRTGKKSLAAATLLLDAAKGAGAVLIARAIWPDLPQAEGIAAIGAFLGHLYPVWLGFKGGKGVATLIGIVLALHWPSGLVMMGIWLLTFLALRYSSVGGMMAAIAAPVSALLFGRIDLAILLTGLALLVVWKHRSNLGRLVRGEEPKVGRSKAP